MSQPAILNYQAECFNFTTRFSTNEVETPYICKQGASDYYVEINKLRKFLPDVTLKTQVYYAVLEAATSIQELKTVLGDDLVNLDYEFDPAILKEISRNHHGDIMELAGSYGLTKEECAIYIRHVLPDFVLLGDYDYWYCIKIDDKREIEFFASKEICSENCPCEQDRFKPCCNDEYDPPLEQKKFFLNEVRLKCPLKPATQANVYLDTYAVHPGVVLQETFVKRNQVDLDNLHQILKDCQFKSILNRQYIIMNDQAAILSKFFNTSRRFWLDLYNFYFDYGHPTTMERQYITRIFRKLYKADFYDEY